MPSEKNKTAVVIGSIALVIFFVVGGIALKMHSSAVQEKELARLKEKNPVEYHILHTPPAKNTEATRNAMLGLWHMAALRNRQNGRFIFLPPDNGYFKSWTETNWSITTYDQSSNVVYTAGGHYTLDGENYSESVEAATGFMTRYLGAHPQFKIRVDGDTYYQMSAEKEKYPLEEMWRRSE